MVVPTDDWLMVFPAERSDPKIIGWDWVAGLSQFIVDCGIVAGGLVRDIENDTVANQAFQPSLVTRSIPRLRNTISILANHDDWDRYLVGAGKNRAQCGIVVGDP